MVNQKIEDIEGIGPAKGEKFRAAGVKDTNTLLEKGASKAGRKELATATGMSESQILRFVNMADLYRVKGIGSEYSELLEAAGVDTVVELAARNGANLTAKMKEVNETKKLVRALPSEKTVEGWIEQAKTLGRMVTH